MDDPRDRLALAVGKIILAWGGLDSQLHMCIRQFEGRLGVAPSKEGRFSQRRKIFRRLAMRLTNDDPSYGSDFDRVFTRVVALERKRGRIAHGSARHNELGGGFLNVPEALAAKPDEPIENFHSYEELSDILVGIYEATGEIIRLSTKALPRD